ncbi:Uncharacterized protein NV38_0001945 [Leptospira kirschneri serovar Mozdok]|nr:Uncharacterized protein NV38_0001945 [Leptospira kirschneri serovar Mozdok]NDK07001.1 hypothetical protein [Leptospira kirschneri serovar Mozdok]
MFPVCNLLTRAKEPGRLPWQAPDSPRFSNAELTLNKDYTENHIIDYQKIPLLSDNSAHTFKVTYYITLTTQDKIKYPIFYTETLFCVK